MKFVYHIKPENIIGASLAPLNLMPTLPDFEENYKTIYENARAKYQGSHKDVMDMSWPPFSNKLWNDVLFFSPIHPNYIYNEFNLLGIPCDDIYNEYLKIPISSLNLDPNKTLIWSFPEASLDPKIAFPKESFTHVDDSYQELDKVPEKTKKYYKDFFHEHNRRPLMFFYLPHVITTEMVDLAEAEVVDWRCPVASR